MAELADTGSGATLAFVAEATWGTNPGGTLQYIRFNSESLKQTTDFIESGEVTTDRNPRGAVRTGTGAAGAINTEFSADTYDTFLEHAMFSTWSTPLAITSTLNIASADAVNGTCVLTPAVAADVFVDVVQGTWIKLGGWTNAVNNAYAFVTNKNVNNDELTLSGAAFVNESGGGNETVVGKYLRLGTTRKSMTIERAWTGFTANDIYDIFTGMRMSRLSQTVSVGQIISMVYDFMGENQATGTTSAGSGYTAATSTPVANAIDHIEGVYIGATGTSTRYGLVTAANATEISWQIDNALRLQRAIGSANAIGVGTSIAKITGTLRLYLESGTSVAYAELAKYVAGSTSSVAFRINDDTDAYIVDFPQLIYTDGDDSITGAMADGFVNLSWSAQKDSTNSIAMQVCKLT